MKLLELGWDNHFEISFQNIKAKDYIPGRITGSYRDLYRIRNENGEYLGVISGKFRSNIKSGLDIPVTGDWVAISKTHEMERAVIHSLLPRKSCFYRKKAGQESGNQAVSANIDYLFVVMSLNQDFNINRLERYMILAWNSGAVPLVVLSKSDCCENAEAKKSLVESVENGVDVVVVNTVTPSGLDELTPHLKPSKTIALTGSSGVGKSTLINRLSGADILKTVSIRENDGHGRHATTSRELFILPGGAIIIDNPGMRELQIPANNSIDTAFEDINKLAALCRFRDCSHETEPGCAVREAINNGNLDEKHFQNFRKLQKEVRYQESMADEKLRREEKLKWKKISQFSKKYIKNNDNAF